MHYSRAGRSGRGRVYILLGCRSGSALHPTLYCMSSENQTPHYISPLLRSVPPARACHLSALTTLPDENPRQNTARSTNRDRHGHHPGHRLQLIPRRPPKPAAPHHRPFQAVGRPWSVRMFLPMRNSAIPSPRSALTAPIGSMSRHVRAAD